MIVINVEHDVAGLTRWLDDLQRKHVPFATALALTRTAQKVKAEVRAEMPRVFDRPTPWTLNSLYVKPATKQTLTAKVWFKEAGKGTPAAEYLLPQIEGGPRRLKRFELALKGILPPGMMAVPGGGAKLDQYGNMSRGQIVQILSQLRIQRGIGYESRIGGGGNVSASLADQKKIARAVKRQGYRIFAIDKKHGKLVPGIYARYGFAMGSAVKPLIVFVRTPQYRKRLRFQEMGQRVAAAEFTGEFRTALDEAVASGAQYNARHPTQ